MSKLLRILTIAIRLKHLLEKVRVNVLSLQLLLSFILSLMCILVGEALSLPVNAFNDTTQQLYSELNTKVPSHVVAIDMLQQFDYSQLNPVTMHPQTHLYELVDLQALYRFYQLCAQPPELAMDNPLAKTKSFITAMCLQQGLPISWFASGTFIHPGGGSFALRYAKVHPEQFNQLKPYMHIRELDNDYFTNDLNDNQLQALTRSAQWILGKQFLWVKFPNEYRLYQHPQWQPLVDALNFEIHSIEQQKKCSFIEGSICWLEKPRNGMWLYGGLTILGLLLLGYIGLVVITRHKYYKERQFIVQMLAHELRTPITRLAGTVEIFRTHFDELPDNLHHAFIRLCKDALHLRHLADASKQYLQLDYGANLRKQYIESWHELIQNVVSEYDVDLELKDDKPVNINIYWFTLSLKNLVSNAVKHGIGQVLIKSYCTEKILVVKVQDQGNLDSRKLSQFIKPFNSQHGVGLGLHLVNQVAQKTGGKLRLQGPPTTFVLEVSINE